MSESDKHRETEEIGPIRWPRKAGPYELTLRFEWLEGRWECVGVDVRVLPRASGPPRLVTTSVLRSIPLGKLIEKWRPLRDVGSASGVGRIRFRSKATGHVITVDTPGRVTWAGQPVTITTTTSSRRGGRPPKYGPQHWQTVAQVYREAWVKKRRTPTRAVARYFKVTEFAAAKWVAKCRALGLLPKTTRGRARAGDAIATPTTVRAVASVPTPTVRPTAGNPKKGRKR